MSTLYGRALRLFSMAAFLLVASAAYGQYSDCATVCDPYNSSCGQYCEVCVLFWYEGCLQWEESSCGDHSDGCIPGHCTPNWQESRQYRGSYDGNSFSSCTHHLVEWVTVTDQNACNTNSYYHSYSYCDDTIDDYKNNCCFPSCCSGYGENGTPLWCDGVHHC